jgi:anti-sigma factor RsiW
MKCRQIEHDLGLHLDGELPPERDNALRAHLDACESCRDELARLRSLAEAVAAVPAGEPPAQVWAAIERRLSDEALAGSAEASRSFGGLLRHRWVATAAAVALAIGLGLAGGLFGSRASGAVDFSVLLEDVAADPAAAFERFLHRYEAQPATADEARRVAPNLTFALPPELPGGFRLVGSYTLRFGGRPGVAARYERDGEFLAAIFHTPVHAEEFGTHRDYDCVIGKHRGHKVDVGEWRLVHLTDATTCHCVLSRLDEHTDLPPIMSALVPSP